MIVWGMWHGGPSYGAPSVDHDVESFPSMTAAVDVCRDRAANVDGRTPAVVGSSMWVWFADPRADLEADQDRVDPYPDRIIEEGPRGGWRVTRA